MKLDSYLKSYTEVNSRCIVDLTVKGTTIKVLANNYNSPKIT